MSRQDGMESKENPISDPRVALNLLTDKGARWSHAHLQRFHDGETNILVQYCGRERDPDPDRYYVTSECADILVTNRWVQGIPKHGYTDDSEFELSQAGLRQVRDWENSDGVKALAILLSEGKLPPEIWCLSFRRYGTRKLNWQDDRGGPYFVNLQGKGFIVYLDTEEIARLDEENFAPKPITIAAFQPTGAVFTNDGQGFVFRDPKTGREKIYYPDTDLIRKER